MSKKKTSRGHQRQRKLQAEIRARELSRLQAIADKYNRREWMNMDEAKEFERLAKRSQK